MAHFARLEDNVVKEVIVINNHSIENKDFPESEKIGINYILDELNLDGIWLQTSYNRNFRKNFAGIGYIYEPNIDAFIPPKPFDSWILDKDTGIWTPPTPYPNDTSKEYFWDETKKSWVAEL